MKFRRRSRNEQVEMNLTPLIDCLLFLIIFFMMTTTFSKAAHLQIKLPQAKGDAAPQSSAHAVEIEISATGDYAINGQAIASKQADALRVAIDGVAAGQRDVPFTIAADGQTPHQSVVTVMDVAGQMGFANLSISTRLADDKSR